MIRASFKAAVAHIALNDDPGSDDALNEEAVQGYLTVGLVADIFGVDTEYVARCVVMRRKREQEEQP